MANSKSIYPEGFWTVFPTTYVAYTTMYLLRKVSSISKPFLKESLPYVNDSTLGTIDSAFFFSYTFFQFFAGTLADTYGARVVVTLAFIFCSIGAFLFGYANSGEMMIFAWFLEGIGHAPGFSCLLSTTVAYLPPETASSWTATWTTSQQVGSILSSVLGTYLCATYGCQAPYIFFGVATALVAGLCYVCLPSKSPASDKVAVTVQEVESVVGSVVEIESVRRTTTLADRESAAPEAKSAAKIFIDAFKIKGMIPACACVFFVKTIKYLLIMWLPSLLKDTIPDCDSAVAGYSSSLYDVAGIIGAIIAGVVADSKIMKGRKLWTGTWALALMVITCSITFYYCDSSRATLPILLVAFFAIGCILCAMDMIFGSTAPVELVRRHRLTGDTNEYQATVMSILNGIGSGGGIFQSQMVPIIKDNFNNEWKYVVAFLGLCALAAFGLSFLFINDPNPQKTEVELVPKSN